VHVFAGVFLQVHALDARHPVHAVDVDLQPPIGGEWLLELADLVALRQVGIEVVLAGEDALALDGAAESQRRAHPELDRQTVADRQRARQPQAHRAHVLVRSRPDLRRAGAEQLRLGEQLGVDLQPDHDLVLRHGSTAASRLFSGALACA
jgi:hypothetical protein